jgi:hypothetical protein
MVSIVRIRLVSETAEELAEEIKDHMFWIGGHKPTKAEPWATDFKGDYRIDIHHAGDGAYNYMAYHHGDFLGESTDHKEIKKLCVSHAGVKNRR